MATSHDPDVPPLERKKSVRFKDEVEFHSYLQRAPSIDNLLDLLDHAGNVKTYENKALPPPPTPTSQFTPVNFARPDKVPDNIQLGTDLALGSIAYKGSFISGTVLVRNKAYEKSMCVRYSTDNWCTMKEVYGVYYKAMADIDCFRFLLKVEASVGESSLKFAVKAQVGDEELWDNNGGRDYVLRVVVTPAMG